jgi:hypothetical protein
LSAFLEPPCPSRPTPDQMIERQITSPYSDQVNQTAVRRLILLTLRFCSLGPCVTTSLYSSSVFPALRQPLQESFSEAGRARPSKSTRERDKRRMLVSLKPGADFPRGCAHPAAQPPISATHPLTSIREVSLGGTASVLRAEPFQPRYGGSYVGGRRLWR